MAMDNRTSWLALIVLCLGDLMIVLDVTIVGVALPSIKEDLGFSEASLAWVVNAYLLTFGGFLLLGGRLGDLFGHRRLFLIGIAVFTLASLACGLASSQEMLVAARAVQGVGGAVVSAVALSLMMTLFTEPAERAKAMGIFGFVASGGGSIGVLLGGVLTDVLSWQWIFLVNLPVGVAVVALSLRLLARCSRYQRGRTTRHRRRGHRDGLAHARRLRDRERQRERLDVGPDGRLAGSGGGADGDLHRNRVARALAADAARSLQAAQRGRVERRRRSLGGSDVRLVLPLRALPAARARIQPARGRPRVPARKPDHGRALGRPLRQARHALRAQAAACDRVAARRRSGSCSSREHRSTEASSSTCFRA